MGILGLGWVIPRVARSIWGSFCGENEGTAFLGIPGLGWERKDLPALDFSFWSFRNCCRKLPSFTNLLDTDASFSEPSSLSRDRKTGAAIWELPSPSHVGFGTGKTPRIGHSPHLPPNSQKNPKSLSFSIKIVIFLPLLHQKWDFSPPAPLKPGFFFPAPLKLVFFPP